MTAILGKISPVHLTTAERDAVIPRVVDGEVIIWHETLGRLEYWNQSQLAWLPFDVSFFGDTGEETLLNNNAFDTEEDLLSITVPAGGIYRVEGRVTISMALSTFATDVEFVVKLTDNSNNELHRSVVKLPLTTPQPTEQFYLSLNLSTNVDTILAGSQIIKLRGARVSGTPENGPAGTGSSGAGPAVWLFYRRVAGDTT